MQNVEKGMLSPESALEMFQRLQSHIDNFKKAKVPKMPSINIPDMPMLPPPVVIAEETKKAKKTVQLPSMPLDTLTKSVKKEDVINMSQKEHDSFMESALKKLK